MPRIFATVPDAVRTTLLVWGFEIVLVRVTSAPLAARDIIESLLLWAIVATPAALWARRLSPPSRAHVVPAMLGWGVPVGLAAAILVPVAVERGGAATGVALVPLLVAWAIGARRTGAAEAVFPSSAAILALLLAAVVGTWILDPDPLPDPSLIVGAAGVWCLVGFRARTPRWAAAAAVLGVLVAALPSHRASRIQWTNTSPAPEAPDIVMISIDTLRADVARNMRSYARLASRGITFVNAQSAAPWTLPSMATAMSGQPVPVHGAGLHTSDRGLAPTASAISPSVPLLAEGLSAHGYDTAAIVARNLLLVRRFGFARGFDFYQDAMNAGAHPLPRGMVRPDAARPTMRRLLDVIVYRLPIPRTQDWVVESLRMGQDAESSVDDALRILRQTRNRPLFLWLHFMDCHLPYGHDADVSRTLQAARIAFERTGVIDSSAYLADQWDAARKAYAAEVAHIDRQLDRLLDGVAARARPHGTLIAFLADHGEEFLEHGGVGHGHSLYQELLGIPLILSGDPVRERAGTVVEEVVGVLDLAPTLLAVAGAPDRSLPGQNLLGPVRPTDYVATSVGPAQRRSERRSWFARRQGRWKAIVQPGRSTELYDLAGDPSEMRDLAEDLPEVAARLSQPSPQVAGESRPGPEFELSPGEIQGLRALGYIPE